MATRKPPQLQLVTTPAVKKAMAKKAVPAKKVVTARKATKPTPVQAEASPAPAKKAASAKKAKPASTQGPNVRLFQIYYRPEQRSQLDPAFEPYNNEGDKSPLLEYNVFRKLATSELTEGAELWGALSWKFTQKTGITGAQLRDVIARNPGHDVYYCNPFPELEGLYHNLWLQGETAHPNFLILMQEFFKVAGWPTSHLTAMQSSQGFSAANYFIGSPAFWQKYLAFIETALRRAEKGLSPTARAMLRSSAADKRGLHAEASYLPFIIERTLPVFLASEAGPGLKACKYQVPAAARLNVHQKLLREMKDVAVTTRSNWMASCWTNYRNLYLAQTHDKNWVRKYLHAITPLEVNFQPVAAKA